MLLTKKHGKRNGLSKQIEGVNFAAKKIIKFTAKSSYHDIIKQLTHNSSGKFTAKSAGLLDCD